jgi:hypothetical protein
MHRISQPINHTKILLWFICTTAEKSTRVPYQSIQAKTAPLLITYQCSQHTCINPLKPDRYWVGVVCRLAAVVSTTARRHQYWVPREYLHMLFFSAKKCEHLLNCGTETWHACEQYINIPFLPHREHSVSITTTNSLIFVYLCSCGIAVM